VIVMIFFSLIFCRKHSDDIPPRPGPASFPLVTFYASIAYLY
jgi:hypothetical protein